MAVPSAVVVGIFFFHHDFVELLSIEIILSISLQMLTYDLETTITLANWDPSSRSDTNQKFVFGLQNYTFADGSLFVIVFLYVQTSVDCG